MRLGYLHLPLFPVQRRVLQTPALAGTPFALVAEERGAQRVVFASPAALEAGVQPGQTLSAASVLVPSLPHALHRPGEDHEALLAFAEATLSLAPAFQLDAPEGLWLDASAAPLCRSEEAWADRLLALAASLGLAARVTVASECFTAQALARHSGRVCEVVPEGMSAERLGALPLRALSPEAPRAVASWRALGLSCLREIAAIPVAALLSRGGEEAQRAHALASGADPRLFVPARLAEALEESLTLDWPAESWEPLLFGLKTLLDRLCARLSGRGRAVVRFTLSLALDSGGTRALPLTLARPSAQPRLLLDLLRHQLEHLTLEKAVTGLRLSVEEDCEDRGQQLALGETPAGDAALEVVLSRLGSTLGPDALYSAQLAAHHLPERASGSSPFRPPRRDRVLPGELRLAAAAHAPLDETLLERPSRLLAHPVHIEVRQDGAGAPSAALLFGRWRRILSLAGPERLRGEWWAHAFYREYFRVHAEHVGPLWVFRDGRDGRYFLQGLFD